jgi:hypothetical protein
MSRWRVGNERKRETAMQTTFRLVLALGLAVSAGPALASLEAHPAAGEPSRPADAEKRDEETSRVHDSLALEVRMREAPARAAEERTSREVATKQDPFDRSMDAGG